MLIILILNFILLNSIINKNININFLNTIECGFINLNLHSGIATFGVFLLKPVWVKPAKTVFFFAISPPRLIVGQKQLSSILFYVKFPSYMQILLFYNSMVESQGCLKSGTLGTLTIHSITSYATYIQMKNQYTTTCDYISTQS